MNKKMRMFIFCAVFALIISCKNYADLKQGVEEQVKGFKQGVEKKVKQGIKQTEQKVKGFLEKEEKNISDDEIAKKLREEEFKGKQENKEEVKDDKQEDEEKEKQEEELMQGDDSNNPNNNLNQSPILQANSQDSTPALELTQQSTNIGQQKDKENKQEEAKEEQAKAKAEREEKEKAEQQKRQQEQEEQEKKERKEREQTESKIKMLTEKIDEINENIDDIKQHKSSFSENTEGVIRAQEVIDKVTGPIYDYFTDDNNQAIYYTWSLDEEEDSELTKLLKQLSDTRGGLRTKLNEGNQAYTLKEPKLKENVKVSEIESDLEKLKSELEKVKNYLENTSNFETIKEYIENIN
ncbi:hypothetical protein [Borreliella valaisiana]|uniref:hypothetical protein n=1 Tax=Borreliella valaisiana TaxID=62088 RepID=UPI003B22634E